TDGARLAEYISGQIPAADIHGSAHDLALFARLHLKAGRKRLLPDKALDAMWKHPVRIPKFKYEYGLGWSVGVDAKGRRHVFHRGRVCWLRCPPEPASRKEPGSRHSGEPDAEMAGDSRDSRSSRSHARGPSRGRR